MRAARLNQDSSATTRDVHVPQHDPSQSTGRHHRTKDRVATGIDTPMSGVPRDSAVRLAATLVSYLAGAVVAVITARWLGPSGKGIAALIGLLAGLVTRVAVLSLGEAAVVLVGKGAARREAAIGVVLAFSAWSSLAGAAVFAGVAVALLSPDSGSVWAAIGLGALSIPLLVLTDVFSQLLLLEKRVMGASVVFAVVSLVTLIATAILIIPLDLEVPGAVAATAVGGIAGVVTAVRGDLLVAPRLDRIVLRKALAYGIPAESGVLLTQAAARLDLVLVFALAGSADAGIYSVALTVGALANLAPAAIAFAAFPRLARQPDVEGSIPVLARLGRMAVLSSILTALPIAAGAAVVIGPLFGQEFEAAVVPAVILTAAGVAWGLQWTLTRAVAALGKPALLVSSFGTALVVMVGLDLVLIPSNGLDGAAVASGIGSLAGLAVCLRALRAHGLGFRELVPTGADLGVLKNLLAAALSASGSLLRNAFRDSQSP